VAIVEEGNIRKRYLVTLFIMNHKLIILKSL